MQGPLFALLSVLCTFGAATGSLVEVLTDSSFAGFVAENELVLVEFYAPWCGHCKTLEPEYDKASLELEGSGALLAKVDATVEKALGEKYEIQGFPTIKLFRSGEPSPYEGGRTAKDIVSYMKKQMGPAITNLDTAESLAEFIARADPVVVGFGAEGSDVATFLNAYAKKKRDDFSFGLVTSADVAGENKMDSLTLFKPFDELKNEFTGAFEDDEVTTFLKGNSMKSCDEIGPDNYQKYLDRGLPLCWFFYDPEGEDSLSTLEEYKPLGAEFKAKLSMVYLNGVQYKSMAQKMGLTGDKLPGISIESPEGQHWVFPEGDEMTKDSMQQWLTKWSNGELAATVKSEAVPDPLFDEHNVATVVGDNFAEVVMDAKKDVLIEFYAPWCGHCKSLIPIWESLGKSFKGIDTVVIAKTDATANDYPAGFKVEGFPTIKFVKGGDNEILEYKGGRDLDSFSSYLEKNAHTAFEKPKAAPEAEEEDNDEL